LPVEWNDDDPVDVPTIVENLRQILLQIQRDAPNRRQPNIALAQDWHRHTYKGVRLPVDYFAGEIRDSDTRYPELFGYEVIVGGFPGAPSWEVPDQLARFEDSIQEAVADWTRSCRSEPILRGRLSLILS
jgi:hypothetical protein